MTTDIEHAAALRRLLMFTPSMEGDSTNIAIERAIEVLETPVSEGVEEWVPDYRAQRDEALAEVERLRTALFGDVAEYVILTPENFKKLVTEMDEWRALADRLIQGFGRDDPEDYHATTAEYRRLKGDS